MNAYRVTWDILNAYTLISENITISYMKQEQQLLSRNICEYLLQRFMSQSVSTALL